MGSAIIQPSSSVTGAQTLKGDLDCSTNPNYPSAVVGDTYVVTVAGKVGGASGTTVEVGDQVVCKTTNAGGTQASVGTSWFVVQGNVAFSSVGLAVATAASEAAARTALGLGTAATQASGAFATAAQGTDARTPTAHAASHASGGTDAVKLDDLAAPDDNTDLNATTSAHGLLPKLGGGTTNFLRADGSWATAPVVIQLACSDESTALTSGTAKATFRMPYAMAITQVRASVNTAPTGSTLIVDINENGTSILSTKLSIDANEKTSTTAATAAVISDSALADDAEITIDIDQIGTSVAGAGLKITIIGTPV